MTESTSYEKELAESIGRIRARLKNKTPTSILNSIIAIYFAAQHREPVRKGIIKCWWNQASYTENFKLVLSVLAGEEFKKDICTALWHLIGAHRFKFKTDHLPEDLQRHTAELFSDAPVEAWSSGARIAWIFTQLCDNDRVTWEIFSNGIVEFVSDTGLRPEVVAAELTATVIILFHFTLRRLHAMRLAQHTLKTAADIAAINNLMSRCNEMSLGDDIELPLKSLMAEATTEVLPLIEDLGVIAYVIIDELLLLKI